MSHEDDNGRQHRLGGIRFESVITVGNIVSMVSIAAMVIGGVWAVYTSLEGQIIATNLRVGALETMISVVRQQTENNTVTINRDRTDSQIFSGEMRGSLNGISEQISKLREELARNGSVKGR